MNIAATLSAEQAGCRTWEVLVVGAGPAGALAARELARRGVSVLLVDRSSFPRPKVCGCCLNLPALATLARVGLSHLTADHGAIPLRTFRLASGKDSADVPLPGGAALSREAFDASLIEEAIRCGAHFLPSWSVEGGAGSVEPDSWAVRCKAASGRTPQAPHTVTARVVLAATGLGGGIFSRRDTVVRPASRIGAGAISAASPDFYRPGTIYMTCGEGGYLGLVRLEDGRLGLATALDPAWVRRRGGLPGAAETLLGGSGWPIPPDLHALAWRGTPRLSTVPRRVAGHRLFLLGDAAGYVEPFTGEGMGWALASAEALAPLAARAARRWDPALPRTWAEMHRALVGGRQRACRVAAAVLRRPLVTGAIVRILSVFPSLAIPVVRHLNQPRGAWSTLAACGLAFSLHDKERPGPT